MISVPIRITMQEVIDFPKESISINDQWKDIIDPAQDDRFRKPRKTKRSINNINEK